MSARRTRAPGRRGRRLAWLAWLVTTAACRAILGLDDDVHLREGDADPLPDGARDAQAPDGDPLSEDAGERYCPRSGATLCADFDDPDGTLAAAFTYALHEPASTERPELFRLEPSSPRSPPHAFFAGTNTIPLGGAAEQHALVWSRVVRPTRRVEVSFALRTERLDGARAVTALSLHFGNVNDETRRPHVDIGLREGVLGLTQFSEVRDGGLREQRGLSFPLADPRAWHHVRLIVDAFDASPQVDLLVDGVRPGAPTPRAFPVPGPGLTLFVGVAYAPPGLSPTALVYDDVSVHVD